MTGAGPATRGASLSGPRGPAEDDAYRAFLRGRWPARTRILAAYALVNDLVFFAFDRLLTLDRTPPPSWLELAEVRLPWLASPILGLLAVRFWPGWRGLPALVIALSMAFTWGTSSAYLALGLGGSVVQAMAVLGCAVTAATFMPLTRWQRAAVFAFIAVGVMALDLLWPQARPVRERLLADLALLGVLGAETLVFENYAASQRRGVALRRDLERTVSDLKTSEARAFEAAARVVRLAGAVTHEVNSPLAAVKANVRWLGEHAGTGGPERAEVVRDTLEAVDRIERTMVDLRLHATGEIPDGGTPVATLAVKPGEPSAQ